MMLKSHNGLLESEDGLSKVFVSLDGVVLLNRRALLLFEKLGGHIALLQLIQASSVKQGRLGVVVLNVDIEQFLSLVIAVL